MVRAPGPVQFSRTRMSGSGTGMTYDKAQDLLVILDQATIRIGADEEGGTATEIASGTATVARREQLVRFEARTEDLAEVRSSKPRTASLICTRVTTAWRASISVATRGLREPRGRWARCNR